MAMQLNQTKRMTANSSPNITDNAMKFVSPQNFKQRLFAKKKLAKTTIATPEQRRSAMDTKLSKPYTHQTSTAMSSHQQPLLS